MRKFKVIASKEQLESVGIDYDITGSVGVLKTILSDGYLTLEIEHGLSYRRFINDFDIPSYMCEEELY